MSYYTRPNTAGPSPVSRNGDPDCYTVFMHKGHSFARKQRRHFPDRVG